MSLSERAVARYSGALVKRAPTRLGNIWWEWRLGIETRGLMPIEHADSGHYATMSYSTIWSILDHLALGPSDVFADIGSGKGRVLCCAAQYSVDQVIGVDLSEELCAVARENVRRLRHRRAPITVHQCFADAFDYSSATVLFLFNPFGASTLASVLDKIRRSAGRAVRIAYAYPLFEEVFGRQDWLTRVEHWDAAASGVEHAVSFYRSG
jgi:SAM-dependent methyltransferase